MELLTERELIKIIRDLCKKHGVASISVNVLHKNLTGKNFSEALTSCILSGYIRVYHNQVNEETHYRATKQGLQFAELPELKPERPNTTSTMKDFTKAEKLSHEMVNDYIEKAINPEHYNINININIKIEPWHKVKQEK